MESKIVEYFDWDDIEKAICAEMGIAKDDFRDYHRVIGGDYKDLWHEWLAHFDDVTNDTIKRNDLGENIESKLEWVTRDGKEWLEPFVRAVYEVWDNYMIEFVRYSW
jgi:hypothetical protein